VVSERKGQTQIEKSCHLERQFRFGINFSMSVETLFSTETHPRPRSWRFWLFVASPFLFLAMCTVAIRKAFRSVPQAQHEVSVFHDRLEAGRYDEIYATASPAFQRSVEQVAFDRYLGAIHAKMGACKPPTQPVNYFANSNQYGTTIRLSYRIQCSNGPLDEVITFGVEDGVSRLRQYRASSPFQMK
jgi:hypothetical protein